MQNTDISNSRCPSQSPSISGPPVLVHVKPRTRIPPLPSCAIVDRPRRTRRLGGWDDRCSGRHVRRHDRVRGARTSQIWRDDHVSQSCSEIVRVQFFGMQHVYTVQGKCTGAASTQEERRPFQTRISPRPGHATTTVDHNMTGRSGPSVALCTRT